MGRRTAARGESQVIGGSHVPGRPGTPAFTLRASPASPIPVMIAVPHAGRAYAPGLLERMRHPAFATPRLEDRHADLLGERIAAETGAALLIAHAPRAMIDLNRAADDIDWGMIAASPPPDASARAASFAARARSGLGLVPRRLPGLGELWKWRLDHGELDERIALVHQPYHATLARTLAAIRERWGAALLIDLHSMPPLRASPLGEPPPHVVLGDRFGASCAGALVSAAFACFAEEGWPAAHNRPYAGGYVLERHARRDAAIHALQIEVDRSRYLDSRLVEPGDGLEETVRMLTVLVRRLAETTADLARATPRQDWRIAAE